ncbi:hypothetical protein [Shewanella sp. YLB-07]|uniref:hypothetical protein n=1 Tax=Shewanella sp. YLB-07 TaxID=2601268 RepID=UPI00128DD7C4|nr:hypothetical protein [Shewanella sp. YLB-07]MPY23759.1 hypothetical protein [Shewanella sp. YLB-07]
MDYKKVTENDYLKLKDARKNKESAYRAYIKLVDEIEKAISDSDRAMLLEELNEAFLIKRDAYEEEHKLFLALYVTK